ncbi:MAG: hypothetical protein ACRC35_07530 [Angustibacter sp.]
MTARPPGASAGAGATSAVLLLRGRGDVVRRWAARGLMPIWIVPELAWTLAVPAGAALSAAPYDDPVRLLGGRVVPARLRPAVLVVAQPDRFVVTIQGGGRWDEQRWLAWSRGVGLLDMGELPPAPVRMLAAVAGARPGTELKSAVAADNRSGAQAAEDVLAALDLPAPGLLTGRRRVAELPGAALVEPDSTLVAAFDEVAALELAADRELSGAATPAGGPDHRSGTDHRDSAEDAGDRGRVIRP